MSAQELKPKFKVGDKVRVVGYGSIHWEGKKVHPVSRFERKPYYEDDDFRYIDMQPELVGKVGVVDTVSLTQGRYMYAVDGIPGKHAWYSEGQLKAVKQKKNASPPR